MRRFNSCRYRSEVFLGSKDRPEIDVTFRRNSVERKIAVVLRPRRSANAQVVFSLAPTNEQLAVRRAWIARQGN